MTDTRAPKSRDRRSQAGKRLVVDDFRVPSLLSHPSRSFCRSVRRFPRTHCSSRRESARPNTLLPRIPRGAFSNWPSTDSEKSCRGLKEANPECPNQYSLKTWDGEEHVGNYRRLAWRVKHVRWLASRARFRTCDTT